MLRTALTTSMLILAAPAFAQQAYLCMTEVSAGMAFDQVTRQWHATQFAAGQKFLFRRATASDIISKTGWALFPFGASVPMAICNGDFKSPEVVDNHMRCPGLFEFEISITTLRFQIYYAGAFVDPKPADEGKDTPVIQIGGCTPL